MDYWCQQDGDVQVRTDRYGKRAQLPHKPSFGWPKELHRRERGHCLASGELAMGRGECCNGGNNHHKHADI
jgi:hypothetical protein